MPSPQRYRLRERVNVNLNFNAAFSALDEFLNAHDPPRHRRTVQRRNMEISHRPRSTTPIIIDLTNESDVDQNERDKQEFWDESQWANKICPICQSQFGRFAACPAILDCPQGYLHPLCLSCLQEDYSRAFGECVSCRTVPQTYEYLDFEKSKVITKYIQTLSFVQTFEVLLLPETPPRESPQTSHTTPPPSLSQHFLPSVDEVTMPYEESRVAEAPARLTSPKSSPYEAYSSFSEKSPTPMILPAETSPILASRPLPKSPQILSTPAQHPSVSTAVQSASAVAQRKADKAARRRRIAVRKQGVRASGLAPRNGTTEGPSVISLDTGFLNA